MSLLRPYGKEGRGGKREANSSKSSLVGAHKGSVTEQSSHSGIIMKKI